MKGIIWFRNDIRLEDNETLIRACQECSEVIPVYILDERWLKSDQWGHIRIGPIRLNFIFQGLKDLKNQFYYRHGNLLFYIGKPEEILPKLASRYNVERIYALKAYASEEINVEEAVRAEVPMILYHTSTLIHPDDLPHTIYEIPDIFTDFRKKIEKFSTVRPPLYKPEKIKTPPLEETKIPSIEDLRFKSIENDSRSVVIFQGGETQAWKRLNYYF